MSVCLSVSLFSCILYSPFFLFFFFSFLSRLPCIDMVVVSCRGASTTPPKSRKYISFSLSLLFFFSHSYFFFPHLFLHLDAVSRANHTAGSASRSRSLRELRRPIHSRPEYPCHQLWHRSVCLFFFLRFLSLSLSFLYYLIISNLECFKAVSTIWPCRNSHRT